MRIARRAGLFMGRHLNASEDSLDFFDLSERWSARRHAAWETGDPMYAPWRLRRDLRRAIEAHRGPMEDPGAAWGWKQPRSIHFLPLLHRRYPDMRFIHVIRDGRDLAFGRETAFRIAVGVDGSGVYSAARGMAENLDKQPAPVRMAAFWERVNVLAADYGESEMGDSYRRVRLEDICANPSDVVRDLFDFVGAGADDDARPRYGRRRRLAADDRAPPPGERPRPARARDHDRRSRTRAVPLRRGEIRAAG